MLIIAFLFATAALLLQSTCLPEIPLHAYMPWIAFATLHDPIQKDLWKPLWQAAASGILPDLLSDHPIGLHPIIYALTAALLFRFRNYFLYKHPLHLSLFTALASCTASLFQVFFLFLFDKRIAFAGKWIFLEWIGASLLDGIYALVCFSLPLAIWFKMRHTWTLFWLKRDNSPT